jgi:hypothetical protein
VFARDNFTCQYCLTRLTYRQATIDHLIPASWFAHRGDAWTWDNLTTACGPCNFAKADTHPALWGWPNSMPAKPSSDDLAEYFNTRHLDRGWIDSYDTCPEALVGAPVPTHTSGSNPDPGFARAGDGTDAGSGVLRQTVKAMEPAGCNAGNPPSGLQVRLLLRALAVPVHAKASTVWGRLTARRSSRASVAFDSGASGPGSTPGGTTLGVNHV